MKKIFSMLLAVALVASLAVPAFAASWSGTSSYGYAESTSSGSAGSIGSNIGLSSGTSTSTSTGTSTNVSISAQANRKGYFSDTGGMSNVPVKIYAFTTKSSSVKVQIGSSTFTLPVRHYQSGSATVSSIKVNSSKSNVYYGFGSPYNMTGCATSFNITIRHYGSSVPTHILKACGSYSIKTPSTITYPANSRGSTSFYTIYNTRLNASGSFGYYSTSFAFSATDDNHKMVLGNYDLILTLFQGKINHGISSSTGLGLSGQYRCKKTPFGI